MINDIRISSPAQAKMPSSLPLSCPARAGTVAQCKPTPHVMSSMYANQVANLAPGYPATSSLQTLHINSIRQRCQCHFSQPCRSRRPQRRKKPIHVFNATSISASPRSPSFSVCSPDCSQSRHSPSLFRSSRSMTAAVDSKHQRVA